MDHVGTLVHHLKELKKKHLDMFSDPNEIWNPYETSVNATYGKRIRVFTSARTNFGGRRHNIKDNRAHITAVITAFESGLFVLHFFVAAGKKVMPSWRKKLDPADAHKLPQSLRWMSEEDGLPNDTKLYTPAKGYMTMNFMPDIFKHFNVFVLKIVLQEKLVLLLLMKHSLWKGDEWIFYYQEASIIVVQLPTSSSTSFIHATISLLQLSKNGKEKLETF